MGKLFQEKRSKDPKYGLPRQDRFESIWWKLERTRPASVWGIVI